MWVVYALLSIMASLHCVTNLFAHVVERKQRQYSPTIDVEPHFTRPVIFLTVGSSILWVAASLMHGIQYGSVWGVFLFLCSTTISVLFCLVIFHADWPKKPLGLGWSEFVDSVEHRLSNVEKEHNEKLASLAESDPQSVRVWLTASSTEPEILVTIESTTNTESTSRNEFRLYFAHRGTGWFCTGGDSTLFLPNGMHWNLECSGIDDHPILKALFTPD